MSLALKFGNSVKEKAKDIVKLEGRKEKDDAIPIGLLKNVDTTDLKKRIANVTKDERGYGLTVSSESPVFVQLVKEGGAADRAGVRQGDIIFKVNGNLVTNYNHTEVVRLIKAAGPHVQLTLLSKSDTTSPEKGDISGPTAVNSAKAKELQDDKQKTIRAYYEQVKQDYDRSLAEYNSNRTTELKNICDDHERLLKTLEHQLALSGSGSQSESAAAASSQEPPKNTGGFSSLLSVHTPPPGGTTPSPSSSRSGSFVGGDALDNIQEENNTPENTPSKSSTNSFVPAHRKTESLPESAFVDQLNSTGNSEASPQGMDLSPTPDSSASNRTPIRTASLPTSVHDAEHSPSRSPVQAAGHSSSSYDETTPMSDTPPQKPINSKMQHVQMPQQVQVLSMEDDDFNSTDDEHLEEHGPFGDLNLLKGRPGHMAVFVYYLMSNSDPAPLFFYLVTEQYTQGSKSDLKKWAYEIYSTFVHEKAPLRVEFSEDSVTDIAQTLERSDKEEVMRSVFQVTRHQAQNLISDMLEDFRNKRAMGLAGLYGETELHDEHMDKAQEIKVVEKILWKEFERLLEMQEQSDRNQALVIGLATFFRVIGISPQKSNALERVGSFMLKDKRLFKISKSNKKGYPVKGHTFQPTQYLVSTLCAFCHGLLWGVGQQGFQCMNCEYNAHKHCMDKVMDTCSKKRPGDEKSKNRRSNIYNKFVRRQTGNNASAIEAAKRPHEEQENKLGQKHRTISLPTGINHKDAKRTSFYVASPPSTPVGKQMPHDIAQSDQVRDANPGWVRNQVQQFEGGTVSGPSSSKSPPRGHSPEPVHSDQQTGGLTVVGRSESLNKKGEKRKKSVRRTRSDVQVDDQTLKTLNQSESSSTSSLSNRLESPSQSQDGLAENTHLLSASIRFEESDFDVEAELPSLDQVIPKDMLKKLKPKDKKRQDVLNELLYTERNHLRNLKIMHQVFYVRMVGEHWISKDLVKLLFPNLEEMITLHSELSHSFQKKKDENPVVGDVADLLISRFAGDAGDKFKDACATCCRDQSHALDLLRYKQRKDQKFNTFILELNMNPLCRKLDLKSFLPVQMQRLTKYPLLIENLMKYTSSHAEEHTNLQDASKYAKETLAYVNAAVQNTENTRRLEELHRRMDRRPIENSAHPLLANYKNLDLREHSLIYEGNLVWRINKQKSIDLYVVLFKDIIVLFQKQDDKLVLRCQSTTLVAGKDDTKFTHSPIIVTADCMVKPVATDKKGIFLVSTPAPPQVYELVANSTEEKKIWFKHLSMYAKYNTDGGKQRQVVRNRPQSTLMTSSQSAHSKLSSVSSPHVGEGLDKKSLSVENIKCLGEQVHVEEQPALIQPSEVQVSTVLDEKQSLLELMREQDGIMHKAMQEKVRVLAEHLSVPMDDFDTIAELSSEEHGKKDFTHILLAAIDQSHRLTQLVNQSLSTIPSKCLLPPHSDCKEEGATADVSGGSAAGEVMLAVSRKDLSTISSKLSDQMAQLITSIREKEEEHQRMQQKLKTLHGEVSVYRAMMPTDSAYNTLSRPSSTDTDQISDDQITPTPTPSVQLQQSVRAPILNTTHNELHIVESEPTGSRPVSMISVTSEKSMTSDTSDETSGDVEDNDEEMTQTLTSLSRLQVNPLDKQLTRTTSPRPDTESENELEVAVQREVEVVECTSHAYETVDKLEVLNDYEQDERDDSSVISEPEKLEIVEEKDEEFFESKDSMDTNQNVHCLTQDIITYNTSPTVELQSEDIDFSKDESGQNSDRALHSEDSVDKSVNETNSTVPSDTLVARGDSCENESETENSSDTKDHVDNMSQENIVLDESQTPDNGHRELTDTTENSAEVSETEATSKQLETKDSENTQSTESNSDTNTQIEQDKHSPIPVVTVEVTEYTENICTETVDDLQNDNVEYISEAPAPESVAVTDTQNMDCQTEDDPEILAMCDSYNEFYDNENGFVDAQTHQMYVDVNGVQVYMQDCEGQLEGQFEGHMVEGQDQYGLDEQLTDPMCFNDERADGDGVSNDEAHATTTTSNCDNSIE